MAIINTGWLRLKAIDWIGGIKICEVLKIIKRHQYLPKEELDKIRYARLEELFAIAKRSTTYYSSFNSYEDVPVLDKGMIKADPAAFLSKSYHQKLFKKATGGSTGVTLTYYGSVKSQSYLWGSLIHAWEVAGYRYGDKVAFIAGSALIKSNLKHKIFYRFLNVQAFDAFSLDAQSMEVFINGLRKNKTKLIFGYAMVMSILAEYVTREKKGPFPYLKGIVCTSEVLTDEMRENIQHAFGVKVFNQYGCNEAGIMTFECEQHGLHLISTRSVYDVNQEGLFTSTDLENDAFIFMKYNTGDIVEFSETPCACGRQYPVIKKVLGRNNDVIVDMQHKVLHTNIFNIMFRKDDSIKQFQILFDKETISLYFRVDDSRTPDEYDKYIDEVKKLLTFKEYKVFINSPFLKSENAKHRYVINTSKA